MNRKAKGNRSERKSRDLLKAGGFTVVKSGGSIGPFDLIGFNATGFVLAQIKSNRAPSRSEIEAVRKILVPSNAQKLIHVWKDHQSKPLVIKLGVAS